jgi:hypothetical protein
MLAKAASVGEDTPEGAAFVAGARKQARKYRYGHLMIWRGKPILTSADE